MKKKILIPLIAMVVVIAALVVLLPNLFLKSSKKEQQKPEVVDPKVIMDDYNNGKISMDEFVKLNIDNPNDYVPIDLFMYNNIDQLSESTLTYYLEQINLPDVTFDPDKENEDDDDSNVGLFAKPVYAAEKLKNLDKVVLSENGHFLVWYTTTGKSAITEEQAESIAKNLEATVDAYKDIFGCEYKFEPMLLSEKPNKKQQKALNKYNIDAEYFEKAMHVYVYEFSDEATAQYKSRRVASEAQKRILERHGKDVEGSVVLPYIRFRPSSLSDSERANQLMNHELFHHYQMEILEGHSNPITDFRVFDGTANLASALATPKESEEGFLNEWAHTARKYADRFLSEEFIKEKESEGGENYVSYALFVYLYHYSNCVDNGMHKILESIYQKDGFEYLNKAATLDELAKVQETVALKNITQKYSNKNFVDAPSFRSDWDFPIKAILAQQIPNGGQSFSTKLPRLAMEFYRVTNSTAEAKLEKNSNIAAYLFKEKNGSFEVVDKVGSDSDEHVFDLTEYDLMYLVIANTSLTTENDYKLTITPAKKTDPTETKPEDTTATTDPTTGPDELTTELHGPPKGAKYISYEKMHDDDEETIKEIETYYFDENGKLCYETFTLFTIEDDEVIERIYRSFDNSKRYTNIKREGYMLRCDLVDITDHQEYTMEFWMSYFEEVGYVRTDYNPYG